MPEPWYSTLVFHQALKGVSYEKIVAQKDLQYYVWATSGNRRSNKSASVEIVACQTLAISATCVPTTKLGSKARLW